MIDRYDQRTLIKTAGGAAVGIAPASCTRDGGQVASSQTANSSEASIPLSEYKSVDIDWKQFKGPEISIGAVQHPWITVTKSVVPIFKKLTGIDVIWNTCPSSSSVLSDSSTWAPAPASSTCSSGTKSLSSNNITI